MKTVSKRELNQQTAQVLAEVVAGQDVVITERGLPRWRLSFFDETPDPVERLRAAGRLLPPKLDPRPWWTDEPGYSPSDVDAIFMESRGQR